MKLMMKERRKQVVVIAGPRTEDKKSDRPCGGGLGSLPKWIIAKQQISYMTKD